MPSWRRVAAKPLAAIVGLCVSVVAPFSMAFDFDDVVQRAEQLAQQGYKAPARDLPDALRGLEYAEYAQIQYKPERSLWRNEDLPFDLSFFHEGMHYDTPVALHSIDGESVEEITFNPDDFDYGDLDIPSEALENLGMAGFRVNYPINSDTKQEIMVFLGASYFRVVGRNQIYGLSGRGLAVDTALSSGEEFPRFSEFWIVKPSPDSQYLTIFALLDSPSVTGAYRYVLRPGEDSIVDVQSRLFMRQPVEKLGIAPLTSMFLYGPNQPSPTPNFRPAIHDSNGLLVHGEQEGWRWRPLVNPARLMVDTQAVETLRGYGLLQRSHHFHDYEDLEDRYELRPSAWIEPQSAWGAGRVELVQIPTPDETNDNIVSFWTPDRALERGTVLDYDYRIYWTMNEPKFYDPNLAWVDQTRRSPGEVRQNNLIRELDGTLAFVIDFKGPVLESDAELSLEAGIGDNGELVDSRIVRNTAEGGWRAFVRVKRSENNQPLDIQAFLKDGDRRVSETWFYRLPADA
ncbi:MULTISPECIES: glucan biosynthesis protein G [Halomonadaceae]|uniref:glucan biosynthesis protein G n=1 Tax=Halomonadaceae TaxID=28256 RepID=UPI001597512D|nr:MULTISPECIES: glucan biosynthesis protein G [Halomonas]QJQ94295.1 glucan biosynthesis protein G [Halomonas sp. PA5]